MLAFPKVSRHAIVIKGSSLIAKSIRDTTDTNLLEGL